eukprot:10207713-Prorocentrum_lima.AAC.1
MGGCCAEAQQTCKEAHDFIQLGLAQALRVVVQNQRVELRVHLVEAGLSRTTHCGSFRVLVLNVARRKRLRHAEMHEPFLLFTVK